MQVYQQKKKVANKDIQEIVSAEDVQAFCYGELNLKTKELARLLLADFYAMQEGYQRREIDDWRKIREIMTMIHNTSFNVKKAVSAKELFPLPDEEKETMDEKDFVNLLASSGAKRNTITAEEAKKLGFE